MISSISDIKKELETKDKKELLAYCLKLAKFKKENKELIGFILFESYNIRAFVNTVKEETSISFDEMNRQGVYFIKKSIRKILRTINKYIRFAGDKQTEAELLIHFCNCMVTYSIPFKRSVQLQNIYDNQLKKVYAAIATLHPDLQYDLKKQIGEWQG